MVAIATPIPPAPAVKSRAVAKPSPAASVTPPTPTLAELAAAQQAYSIFACDAAEDAEKLARLRATYARKRAELAAVRDLFEETIPDVVLCAPDGRQVAVRLPAASAGEVLGVLHLALNAGLQQLEQDIISHLRQSEIEAADRRRTPRRYNKPELRLRAPILALCSPGDPALPVTAPSAGEWARRAEAAEAHEEALQQQHGNACAYGREILWHPLFAAEYVAIVQKMVLTEITDFQAQLAGLFNQDRPLDAHDYAYLADVLQEALANQPTSLAELRLRRALACLTQPNAGLAGPQPTPPTPAAPALALAA